MNTSKSETDIFNRSVNELHGVGSKVAELLSRLNLFTIEDVLFHMPLRYEDRTKITSIADVRPGDRVLIEGVVQNVAIVGKRRQLTCQVADDTGVVTLRFFHFTSRQRQSLAEALVPIRCFGEVRSGFRSGLDMTHPEYRLGKAISDLELSQTLTPIYSTTKGLSQISIRKLVSQVLIMLEHCAVDELLPRAFLETMTWEGLTKSLVYIHRPPPDARLDLLMTGKHPVQQRLIFEELLAHQLSLTQLRKRARQHAAIALKVKTPKVEALLNSLPFSLTGAQQKVWNQIQRDIEQPIPMLRLVQGDVGCGKTIVAALAVVQAVASGHQAVVMAPTELLAEQHFRNFCMWLHPLSITVGFLSGKMKAVERREVLADIRSQKTQVVIGTHALFQSDVEFSSMVLLVIDEQHRFGVGQRLALMQKGMFEAVRPHQLIMTATPIPRTLAMTAYGDLDCSVIDELPPGRKPVKTLLMSQQRRQEMIFKMASHCKTGQQVYWVCTLVEESEVLQAQAAEIICQELQRALPDLNIGLVHGRMKSIEKELLMSQFLDQTLDVLVATTVVEVGVDVPNATLMVIENPERLGLAQLHQLRGRVGRGENVSYCVLLYDTPLTYTAKQRLQIMRKSQDGFYIAEQDLQMRGPGEVLGVRQSGLMSFRIADIVRDQAWLDKVNQVANNLQSSSDACVPRLIDRWLKNLTHFAQV